MLPHKPDLESEQERIRDLGGLIVYLDTWRVNGVLSVSRAIGDPEHKPFIIAEPSLAKFEIDPSLDFLVLGCDGLFDQLTSQDIASHVFEFLCANHDRDPAVVMSEVSSYLSKMAIIEGSNDNITSIVIFFKPFEQLIATGYPTGDTHPVDLTNTTAANATSFAPLQVTNGGHFPYTDFAELPIGTSYKLTSQEAFEPINDEYVENNFVTTSEQSDQEFNNPFDQSGITSMVDGTLLHPQLNNPFGQPELVSEMKATDAEQLSTQSEQDSSGKSSHCGFHQIMDPLCEALQLHIPGNSILLSPLFTFPLMRD